MKRLLCAALVLMCCLSFLQCEKTESTYKFVVLAYAGTCSGYYLLDNDEPEYYSVNTKMDGSMYYSYTKHLDSPSTITIRVDASGSDIPSSVVIYVYEDDKIVKEQTFTRTTSTYYDETGKLVTTSIITGSLSYDFGSSSSTSSSD